MATWKLQHSDLAQHQVGMMQQVRDFWLEGHGCDVVLKSCDGAEHRAHTTLLSAASVYFKNLLSGSFVEADQVQRKQPVELAASKAAVSALLDFIYGGQPDVNLETSFELLRLADACNLPKLASAIEEGILASLDSSKALQVLQETHGLHDLKDACEAKVAEDFEACSQKPGFRNLSASQLARILKRQDLSVSREEAVLQGVFNWLNFSTDNQVFLGMLLQHVDFHSFSLANLRKLASFTLSGRNGEELHREVNEALRIRQRKRSQSSYDVQPKRACFKHWSPHLGASTAASFRQVLPTLCLSLCWHQGAIYAATYPGNSIVCWKPGDPVACTREVVGPRTPGNSDMGLLYVLSVSPSGEIFVWDHTNRRIVSFQNGSRRLILDKSDYQVLCGSASGELYVVSQSDRGDVVQKLVGATLQTILESASLEADKQFQVDAMFVTKEEVIYLIDSLNKRILCVNPTESLEPIVVGHVPAFCEDIYSLFVAEGGTIYMADHHSGKVLAFHVGDTTHTEVLQCPLPLRPIGLLVQNQSLYVSMADLQAPAEPAGGIYEYFLPSELQV